MLLLRFPEPVTTAPSVIAGGVCFYVGFLRTRIEARQNLIGGDMVDVHVALDDPAAEPKRQVILDLRLDGAGQGHPRREINDFGGNGVDAGEGGLRLSVVLAAPRQEGKT